MKKFIILSLVALVITALHANGACLLKDINKEQNCTGGASQIPDADNSKQLDETQKETLKQMYQIPTMSYPAPFKFGFPALNQDCMFGACFPK